MPSSNSESRFEAPISIIGQPDFCRHLQSLVLGHNRSIDTHIGNYDDAWSIALSMRPSLTFIQIGPSYDYRTHRRVRSFLEQLRTRKEDQTHVVIVLQSAERLFYGGDLLFRSNDWRTQSELQGLVDSFIVSLSGDLIVGESLHEQIGSVLSTLHEEHQRRAHNLISAPDGDSQLSGRRSPALNTPGWAQSLADPRSRELWLRWLPRYARYLNENPLIIGATGTGKTNLALALHILSERPGKFISITPRDFSSSELVQAELFGAVAGAYTGAVEKWGLVKSAEHGTLFIDELQSIDKDLQGKLITFIENKCYRRVGSSESVNADVRFVFASNRSIDQMLADGVLRDDFAYRLERVQLQLLPLCERKLDIVAGAAFALAKIHRQRPQPEPIVGLTPSALRALWSHPWPGNLRQLENAVAKLCEHADLSHRTVIDERATQRIFHGQLLGKPQHAHEILARAALETATDCVVQDISQIDVATQTFVERAHAVALEHTGGDTGAAAELLSESKRLVELMAQARTTQSGSIK